MHLAPANLRVVFISYTHVTSGVFVLVVEKDANDRNNVLIIDQCLYEMFVPHISTRVLM